MGHGIALAKNQNDSTGLTGSGENRLFSRFRVNSPSNRMDTGGEVLKSLLQFCSSFPGILARFRASHCVRGFLSYQLWSLYLSASTEKRDHAAGGGRTHNLRLRRATLYPVELLLRMGE